ncbi:MAG: hypothetical protein ACE149_11765 [Armatimonadota bacterium]
MSEQEQLPLYRQTAGNLSAQVIVDSRRPADYALVEPTVLVALGHLGIPFLVHDLANGAPSEEKLKRCPLIVLAQRGLGENIGEAGARRLLSAQAAGTGLVSFDPALAAYGRDFAREFGLAPAGDPVSASALTLVGNEHWITALHEAGERIQTVQPVPVSPVGADGDVLLATGDGSPVLVAGYRGTGRFAFWTTGPELWLQGYLGHAQPHDDLFWRALAWSARKPFIMKAMPPFVAARIDDVSGVNSLWWVIASFAVKDKPLPRPLGELLCDVHPGSRSTAWRLRYLDILNEHGYVPSLGLFLDQVADSDWEVLGAKSQAGLAELAAHAWSDHISPQGVRTVDFIYQAGPSRPGRYGEPWSDPDPPEVVRAKFDRLDAIWRSRGIKPARTLNTHWHPPSPACLPYLKERGQVFLASETLFGMSILDENAHRWRLGPYGGTRAHAYGSGCFMDYMPVPGEAPGVQTGDFFSAGAYWGDPTAGGDPSDFLCTETVSDPDSDRTRNNIEQAAQRLARRLRVGLGSMFFGLLFCHEQHLAMLTEPELRTILQEADRLSARFEKEFVGYDRVAEYARSKCDTWIAEANLRHDGAIAVKLSGRATVPLRLYVFSDDGDRCPHRFEQLPPFEGGAAVTF